MQLSEWLSKERGRAASMAREIGAHAPDVSNWAKDPGDPNWRPIPVHFGAHIEIHTKGEVTRQEMFPESWQTIWPELVEKAA
jgi:DNA-binding transcriptional regulator YdaS (Cro superfamily)